MYTKEFIDEVKELYPDNKTMHRLAESGHVGLGGWLAEDIRGLSPYYLKG